MIELDPARLRRAMDAFWQRETIAADAIPNIIRAYIGPEYERQMAVVESACDYIASDAKYESVKQHDPFNPTVDFAGAINDLERSHDALKIAVAALTKGEGV
jgi:hypothetical protein